MNVPARLDTSIDPTTDEWRRVKRSIFIVIFYTTLVLHPSSHQQRLIQSIHFLAKVGLSSTVDRFEMHTIVQPNQRHSSDKLIDSICVFVNNSIVPISLYKQRYAHTAGGKMACDYSIALCT